MPTATIRRERGKWRTMLAAAALCVGTLAAALAGPPEEKPQRAAGLVPAVDGAQANHGDKPRGSLEAPVPVAAPKYLGAKDCSLCHDQKHPGSQSNLVRLDEFATWRDSDPHARAYGALDGEQAHEMERLLDWPSGGAKDAANGCIACHAIDTRKLGAAAGFKVEQGVSCEACHGPASDWPDPHWKTAWRDMRAEEKEAKHGMIDVRNPDRQARLCLSCHLGNVAEGKFVSHAMFAAGHPPLPSFELQTFADHMPPHWTPLEAKPAEVQRQLHYRPKEMPRSRRVVKGGESASAMSAAEPLFLSVGRDSSQGPGHGIGESDWASYDCNACHHELREPSPRQERGYGDLAPGGLRIPSWPTAVTSLDGPSLFRPQVVKLLEKTCDRKPTELLDYNSARQIHWAWDVMFHEVQQNELADAKGQRAAHAKADANVDTQIDAVLGEMSADLDVDPAAISKPRESGPNSVSGPLSVSLEKMRRFDPAKFQQQLARLDRLLHTR